MMLQLNAAAYTPLNLASLDVTLNPNLHPETEGFIKEIFHKVIFAIDV